MKKSDIKRLPQFFEKYIQLAEDEELLLGLKKSLTEIENLDLFRLNNLKDMSYAPGKWTIKDIFQHIIDNERIQAYRALRFSRKDNTELPGYDESLFAKNVNANKRSLEDLINEFSLVRKTSILLFQNMSNESLMEFGKANGIEISVLSLDFVLIGHQKHHLKIIEEKYFPLLIQ